MRTRLTLSLITLLFPTLVGAATFGFPRQPLWVSSTSGTEGEAITMYVAVYNASNNELKGTLSFIADGTVFDTKDVSLGAGNSSLVTDDWKAVKGAHALSAQFVAGSEKDTTEKITVTITAAPPQPPAQPSTISKATDEATSLVQQLTAPDNIVGKTANAIYGQTEQARQAGIDFLTPYAKNSNTNSTGTKLSAQKSPSMIESAKRDAAAAALYAFSTRWLFYALIIMILVLLLRALKNWVNRPRF